MVQRVRELAHGYYVGREVVGVLLLDDARVVYMDSAPALRLPVILCGRGEEDDENGDALEGHAEKK
jgi:hypothetical protein